ncbi:nucleolar protein 14-like isoform X2 [Mya arenaria]|uniref:nucleolar protein 14-like isoform X2 n=1 Tax=Mya arenaria TaxID=6604 RepID=UPI0022E56C9F|nr:nucleolar protein 14-like isoform X2 [Mya arenaria]
MAKKKSKPSADQVRKKRSQEVKKLNPFEVKINKQKHDILGRKTGKFEMGMPGVARSRANKKRKMTLLKEHEQQFKSNKFVDKRFGEHDASLSLEDKMMKRYAMERSRTTTKSKFNLNEEEELTHFGQSLAEIEKFDEPSVSDAEDDDDEDKRAAAKMVAEQHFGGFMKKRDPEDEKKSWKERMEEMISQSKKKKYEKQQEKEVAVQMTVELDEQWKSLHNLLHKGLKATREDREVHSKADDYDMAVRSLQFEMKGQATDRLKSEEELARDEKERLENLEADRRRRMRGQAEDGSTSQPIHRSADDLDDGFSLEPKLDFDYVSYKDGLLLQEEGNVKGSKNKERDESDAEDDSDDDEGGDIDDESENSDYDDVKGVQEDDNDDDIAPEKDIENNDNGKSPKKSKGKSTKEPVNTGKMSANKEKEDNSEEDDSESEESDSFDDIMSDEDDEEATEENVAETNKGGHSEKRKKRVTFNTEKIIEEAKRELPYTFNAPASYDSLLDLLEGLGMEDQLTVIDRIRKCHHPSLAEGNKQKLETLLGLLVQLYCDLCIQDTPQLVYAERLLPHVYQLTQMSPGNAAHVFGDNLTDRQEEFAQICQRKAGRGLYPGLDTLMMFKLVSQLFPTSDFRHEVTTSAMVFMCQILGQSPVNHGRDILAGQLLCTLCLEYVSLSKRYIPEVVNFLHGLLFYASNKKPNKLADVRPPFRPVGGNINLLQVASKTDKLETIKWSLQTMMTPEVDIEMYNTDQFKLTAINTTLGLLLEFSKMYKDLMTFREIFEPVVSMCKCLPTDNYPESIQTRIELLVSQCEEYSSKSRQPLAMQKKKPKPLKMFEPKVEEKFDGRKKGRRGTKDFNEKQKLLHKYKKEMKGAARELKKDTRFLAREKLRDQMSKDEARKRRVREIMGGLAHQEGEYKRMKLGIKEKTDDKT